MQKHQLATCSCKLQMDWHNVKIWWIFFLFILLSKCQSCECLEAGGWIVLLGHEKRASESIKYTQSMAYPLAAAHSKFQRHPKCFNLRNMETLSRRTNIYFTRFLSLLYSDLILQQLPNGTCVCVCVVWQCDWTHWKIYCSTYFLVMLTPWHNICTWSLSRIHIFLFCFVVHATFVWKWYVFLLYEEYLSINYTHTHPSLRTTHRTRDNSDKALSMRCFTVTIVPSSSLLAGKPRDRIAAQLDSIAHFKCYTYKL